MRSETGINCPALSFFTFATLIKQFLLGPIKVKHMTYVIIKTLKPIHFNVCDGRCGKESEDKHSAAQKLKNRWHFLNILFFWCDADTKGQHGPISVGMAVEFLLF